jgi:chromosome condensin MukBEF ATPase and DNA-binding subunit MukB
MPKELYEQVKKEIPSDIGVYVNGGSVKKAKRRKLGVDEQILKDSMIRSLYREAEKLIRSENPSIVEGLEKRLTRYKKDADSYRKSYQDLMYEVREKFGLRWNK